MPKCTVIVNPLKPVSDQRLQKYRRAALAAGFDFHSREMRVYAAIRARKGPCLQKDIAAHLSLRPAEFAQVLRRVEDDHRLVQRVERAGVIHLTVHDLPDKPRLPRVRIREKRPYTYRGMQTRVFAVLPEWPVYQVDVEAVMDAAAPYVIERCARLYRRLRDAKDDSPFTSADVATTLVSAMVVGQDLNRLERSGLIHRFRPDGSVIGFILTLPPQEEDEDTETYRLTLNAASDDVIGGLSNKSDSPDEITLLWNIYFRITEKKRGAAHPRTVKGSGQLNGLLKNTPYAQLAPILAFFLAVPAHFDEALGTKMNYEDKISVFYNKIDAITRLCRSQQSAYSRGKNDPNWYRSALRPLGLQHLI